MELKILINHMYNSPGIAPNIYSIPTLPMNIIQVSMYISDESSTILNT